MGGEVESRPDREQDRAPLLQSDPVDVPEPPPGVLDGMPDIGHVEARLPPVDPRRVPAGEDGGQAAHGDPHLQIRSKDS